MASWNSDEAKRLMEQVDRMLELPSSDLDGLADGSSDSDGSDSADADTSEESSSELAPPLATAPPAPPTEAKATASVDRFEASIRPEAEKSTVPPRVAPIAPKTPGAGIHLSNAMRHFLSRNHSDPELGASSQRIALPRDLLPRSESAEPLRPLADDDGSRLVVVHQERLRVNGGDAGEAQHPKELLQQLLRENGYIRTEPRSYRTLTSFFLPVTPDMVAGYDAALLAAVRAQDVDALRRRHDAGQSLQVCNRFHESVLHAAARRGGAAVMDFLLHTARLNVRVVCDGGRTPLHDACWTARPDFRVVGWLLELCPDLLLLADGRDFMPLDYVPKESHAAWCAFLEQHRDLLRPRVVCQGNDCE